MLSLRVRLHRWLPQLRTEYATELESAIEAAQGEVAAFIFEPVSGATLGAVVPPPGYLQSLADICDRHGVLLIADEVMTGMGRTGRQLRR